jgi:5-methylcytosine-specific restriction endonuclease McrA
MNTKVLTATTASLSDNDLLARLHALAGREREESVELVAHLAELDSRPALYAGQGYGSLFNYCTRALRLSEDAACNRIEAARACRRFPEILELLAAGDLTLTSVRLLARHLTAENHQAVFARASNRSRREIEELVAELAPRPDAPTLVRRLPSAPTTPAATSPQELSGATAGAAETARPSIASPATPRPIVQPLAPERYRVQFTVGRQTQEKLRRLQDLLRREIPDGDAARIFDRALTVLLESVEKTKLATADSPRTPSSIRPGTDRRGTRELSSRYILRPVRRAVWQRDGGQCAHVSALGQRCEERTYLEWHHIRAHAKRGRATVDNIALRCRRHNQYEAELVFGPYRRGARSGALETRRARMADQPA